jgi:hypothetical protein
MIGQLPQCKDTKHPAFIATLECKRTHDSVLVICFACGWRRDGHLGYARTGCGHGPDGRTLLTPMEDDA